MKIVLFLLILAVIWSICTFLCVKITEYMDNEKCNHDSFIVCLSIAPFMLILYAVYYFLIWYKYKGKEKLMKFKKSIKRFCGKC